MTHRLLHPSLALLTLIGLAASFTPARATQIWTGRTYAFSKANFADFTLPANQDRITPYVWITRGTTQGLYNPVLEAAYNRGLDPLSPEGTEWATGDAVNYSSLTFVPWTVWAGGSPPLTVGVNAVVHLITEDIYIDIRFDSWSIGLTGGGFGYHRAVPSTTPTEQATWGRLKALYK